MHPVTLCICPQATAAAACGVLHAQHLCSEIVQLAGTATVMTTATVISLLNMQHVCTNAAHMRAPRQTRNSWAGHSLLATTAAPTIHVTCCAPTVAAAAVTPAIAVLCWRTYSSKSS
jgi:hypothetical protein